MLSAGSARAEVPAPQFGYSGACVFLTDSGPAASGPPLCLSSPIADLVQVGDVLYAARDGGVSVIDAAVPARPGEVFRFAQGHAVSHLAWRDPLLLLDLADKTVLVYNVANRRQPRYAHSYGPDDPQRPDVPQASQPVPAGSFVAQLLQALTRTDNQKLNDGLPLRQPPPPLMQVRRRRWRLAIGAGAAFGALYLASAIGAASSPGDTCPSVWPLAIPLAGPWISLALGCRAHGPSRLAAGFAYGFVSVPIILDGLAQLGTFIPAIIGLTTQRRVWVQTHALQLAPLRVPGSSGLAVSFQF